MSEPSCFWRSHIAAPLLAAEQLSIAGWVLPYDKPILIVAENLEAADLAERSLYRLGFDNVEVTLPRVRGLVQRNLPVAKLSLAKVQDLNRMLSSNRTFHLRRSQGNEWNEGHIEGSTASTLANFRRRQTTARNKPIS